MPTDLEYECICGEVHRFSLADKIVKGLLADVEDEDNYLAWECDVCGHQFIAVGVMDIMGGQIEVEDAPFCDCRDCEF